MNTTIVLIIVILVVLLMAFYSGIEVAFAAANRLNVELKKKQGSESGILLSKFFEHPSRFIGVTIVAYNFFLVCFILLVSTFWKVLLDVNPFINKYFNDSGKTWMRIFIEIVLSLVVVVLISDIIPRAIFRAKADTMLNFGAKSGLLRASDFAFWWIAKPFINISNWILDIIFNVRVDKKKESFSRADLDYLIQQTGPINDENQNMNAALFKAALTLPKVKIRESLIPRKEIEAIPLTASIEEMRQKMIATKLSKLVVYDQNIDQILGYVHQLDLFKNPASVKDILLPIPAVPESMSVSDLISRFTKERKSIAWVVDEFGGTAGIVTMEDLLEEIFGEIKDEFDVEELEEKRINENEFVFSGRLELDYLNEHYGLEFPENESETLSGYIIHQHEKIPRQKERIVIGDYEFEVLQVTETRIESVKLKRLQ